MSPGELSKEKLKLLFNDLLKGFCAVNYKTKTIRIKHLTCLDVTDFDLKHQEYLELAKSQGAPTIEDREAILIQEGSWSHEKNKQIKDNQMFIDGMRESKAKHFRQAEIEHINKTIAETEEKVRDLEIERFDLLQCTAESFAAKKINEYQILRSFFYEDSPFFSTEEYEDLSDKELSDIAKLYNEKFIHFNPRNFKRIALSSFFLNPFYLCKDNPYTFFGKPVIDLTLFQTEVFSHAVFFKHILSTAPAKPPNHIMEDPDTLIDWWNASKSMKEQVLDKGKKPDDVVGLTEKDRKLLGINTVNPHERLINAARAKGAPLSAMEIMKLQGAI